MLLNPKKYKRSSTPLILPIILPLPNHIKAIVNNQFQTLNLLPIIGQIQNNRPFLLC